MSLPRPASRLLPGLLACALLAACRATAPAAPAVVDASPVVDAPALAAREAVIEGRVTGAFAEGLGGWFLQSATPGRDQPAAVFVETVDGMPAPAAGAHVRVSGTLRSLDRVPTLQPARIDTLTAPAPTLAPLRLASAPGDWSRLAGQWVRIEAPLTVSGQHERATRGTLVTSVDGRLYVPTEIAWPGVQAAMVQAANDSRRVLIDDGRNDAPADGVPWYLPETARALRSGSVLTGVEGIVDHRHGAWRLQLTAPVQVQPAPRPAPPQVPGDVRIAAFNLENLFNGDGRGGGFPTARGAETPAQYARQLEGLVATITALDVDVAALMELENDGYDAASSLAQLVDALNAAGPARDWRFVDAGTGPGTDAIRVGLIYRATRVQPKGAAATLGGGPFARYSRAPLAQAFVPVRGGRPDGADFSVVAVHFKSKGCGNADGADADTGDGQACWNATRTESARRLLEWLATAPTGAGERVAVVGDFNAYAREDPLRLFYDAGWRDPFAAGPDAPAHSFVFNGQAGRLDHALLSRALAARVVGAAKWHTNADEPDDMRAREASGPWRSSDHDPLVVGLKLRGR
ncbi:ExeM/NucH family extracellular endonuclease [Luteimonas sp BLCC-B24]|uniref:ExeM/NucH family extracellular endonuclease n=1 Tax=Luteimonas sp. BLCC-B24 TaxID=3025317 RepID=UPI00234E18E1|nr:ExeM/NucH family extracellular endonuclease [Luteimonas sp. BLCC-B24]MDC7807024.1 ExeM/NucH family extracellular endonuclease [Luteimonas sp. BLCC-B24]